MNDYDKETMIRGIFTLFCLTILIVIFSMTIPCYNFRKDIITLSDSIAKSSFTQKIPMEISDIRDIEKPISITDTTERQIVEKNEYEIIAKVKSFYKLSNLSYKIVMYQPDDTISNIYVIALNPECIKDKESENYKKVKSAYDSFVAFSKLNGKEKSIYYKVSGALFFSNEKPNKKDGLANGIQIAPLFSFKRHQ